MSAAATTSMRGRWRGTGRGTSPAIRRSSCATCRAPAAPRPDCTSPTPRAKDGTAIGAVTPGAIMSALLDGRSDSTFDPTRRELHRHRQLRHAHLRDHEGRRPQTFDDMLKRKTVIGSAAVNDGTARLRLHGEERHRRAALDRHRLQGHERHRRSRWSAARSTAPAAGTGRASSRSAAAGSRKTASTCTSQIGHDPDEELTRAGVPPIWKFIKSDEDRKVVELIIGQQVFHRSYIAPPGVPAAQLAILRTSFMATMRDPQFLADAEKTGIDIAAARRRQDPGPDRPAGRDAGRGRATRQTRDPALRGHRCERICKPP